MTQAQRKESGAVTEKQQRDNLVLANQGLVYDQASKLKPKSRHRDFVEDLQGEGFRALVRAADLYDSSLGEFSTYATTAIRNEMIAFINKDALYKSREKQWPKQNSRDDNGNDDLEIPVDCIIDTPPDEHGLMLRNSVEAAMECLDARDRELIRLRYFEELTFQEIGYAMGFSLQNADAAIRRALAKMRDHVDPEILHERSSRTPIRKKGKDYSSPNTERLGDLLDKSGD